jgi:anti-sigma factor RsiW
MLYLDSEGDPELHLRISDHLGMCPACAEWFTQQQRFEQAIGERLAAGQATPELWERALGRAGLGTLARRRRRLFLWGGLIGTAAAAILGVVISLLVLGGSHGSDLAPAAADLHSQLLQGEVRLDVVSTSDKEVEDRLRTMVSFPVHCPPRKDVNFAVRGAGVCRLKDHKAAYIVGKVGQEPVSILVLDRASLAAFPHERSRLAQGGGRHRCTEGSYQMISGLTADNVVVVIGKLPPEDLEKLLNAYGSYHEEV